MGSAAVLNTKWAVNKDSGCTINIALGQGDGMTNTAMKVAYSETATGWAGATVNKKADWSKADSLEFQTIPDGNNQLVVIQISAGGKTYEAYMNSYDAYRDKTNPMKVTIPSHQFISRDESGQAILLVSLLLVASAAHTEAAEDIYITDNSAAEYTDGPAPELDDVLPPYDSTVVLSCRACAAYTLPALL